MGQKLSNIYRLGVKELWSLWRDPMMLVLILFTFTFSVYMSASSMPETLHKASLAVVDEDSSPLSHRIVSAFYPPQFTPPVMIAPSQIDPGMDEGTYTFVLHIPSGFQRDVLAGRPAEVQLNTDATRMSQAFTGSGYIQQIVLGEANEFVQRYRGGGGLPVDLELRARFNPTLDKSWFGGLSQIINQITLLSIVLTGAALIREREHGTIEHLLVMPVRASEIAFAKILANGLVILLASIASLWFVVHGAVGVPLTGSLLLFTAAMFLYLFSVTSLGMWMATLAPSMPQFGLFAVPVYAIAYLLSGAATPLESMPSAIRTIALCLPTTQFVSLSQAILYRGAGVRTILPELAIICGSGVFFVAMAVSRFRSMLSRQG